jgi:hypothetical protein
MTRVLDLPTEALSDAMALVGLSQTQLLALEQLLSTEESLQPVEPSFIEKVSESLGIDERKCRQVVPISLFLLGTKGSAEEVVGDLRRLLEEEKDSDLKARALAQLDTNRKALESVCTKKPERTLAIKIRNLRDKPEPTAESFRTICQLRPLFEGAENQEDDIVGLVPSILVEIELSMANGEDETVTFSLSRKNLESFKKTLERALYKIDKIQERYGNQLIGN